MSHQSAQTLLALPTGRISAEPAYVVLQREFARRQPRPVDPRPVASDATSVRKADPGVYAIRNRITGRVYVSGDLDVEVGLAFDREALKHKQHRNAALQDEWDWYGEENFTFNVLGRIESR